MWTSFRDPRLQVRPPNVRLLRLRRNPISLNEVDRERDDPQQQQSDDPFPGCVREAVVAPVTPTRIDTDPDRARNEQQEKERLHPHPLGVVTTTVNPQLRGSRQHAATTKRRTDVPLHWSWRRRRQPSEVAPPLLDRRSESCRRAVWFLEAVGGLSGRARQRRHACRSRRRGR